MKECVICKEFERNSKYMGICSDTGEAVGINNSCKDYKSDAKKIEAISEEIGKLYFDSNFNMTAKEALQRAKEIYKEVE